MKTEPFNEHVAVLLWQSGIDGLRTWRDVAVMCGGIYIYAEGVQDDWLFLQSLAHHRGMA